MNKLNIKKIKWCLGCGNYSILTQFINFLKYLKINKKYIIIVSGIGCSSRLPYYTKFKGVHTIHGRAIPIATGIKLSNNKFNVWVITGDGDSFSIGLSHLLHAIRRNINLNILIFNNGIYALTKGQESYTNYNNINSFSTLSLMLSSGATFIARSLYNLQYHLKKTLFLANKHFGTSCVEIIQNCPIYNNIRDKLKNILILKNNKKLVYFNKKPKCIILKKDRPIIKNYIKNLDNIWTHNIYDTKKSFILSNFNKINKELPLPIGIIYKKKGFNINNIYNKNSDKEKINIINILKHNTIF